MKKTCWFIVFLFCALAAEATCKKGNWSKEELSLINEESSMMRVLQVTDKRDAAFLRRRAQDIPSSLVGKKAWNTLKDKMFATVKDEKNPGVGIAGPQVGISRRVVAVQRFDKQGEPFEIYPNIRIIAARGERAIGPEGCLSVPDQRGDVLRWQDIDITYTSTYSRKDTTETIKGFTAVIFQHECDHLDGVIYTDRVEAQKDPQRIADDIHIVLNHENGQYKLGETVTVTAGMLGIYDKPLEMTILRFGKREETIKLGKVGIKDTIYTCTPTEPTAIMLEFHPEGQTPAELPEDVDLKEDIFRIGFIAGTNTFKPGNTTPADVRKFWSNHIAKMRELPMMVQANEMTLSGKDAETIQCFDVEVNGPDGVPVKGYYAKPANAAPHSLPIVIRFHAAGVVGHWVYAKAKDAVRYAKKGFICFDFNALGIKNDQDKAYYEALASGELKGYSSRPLEDKETYFFKNMILRAVRGLDYATQDPAWDGKTVLVMGESQGGYQSAMLAALDKRVTDVVVTVPAGVGSGGSRASRCDSWPNVLKNSDYSEYAMQNAGYFDAAILLKGCKANCLVEVGLIDTTCPPAEVFSGFNGVAGKVRYITSPYRCHHLNKMAKQYRYYWDENLGKVREDAITAISQRAQSKSKR